MIIYPSLPQFENKETNMVPLMDRIDEIEEKLLACPQVKWETNHHFGPGVYIREMIMPGGTFVIGHHHKESHLNIMLKGRLRMAQPDGSFIEMVAPYMYTSGPGRKAAFIIEDVVWLNVHPNLENITNIETLDDIWCIKSEAWKEAQTKKLEKDSCH
jgi:hypothetical protein